MNDSMPASRNAPTRFCCPVCEGKSLLDVKWISMCGEHRQQSIEHDRRQHAALGRVGLNEEDTGMNYRTLTNNELYLAAERDPRYLRDPLFTELALRTQGRKEDGYNTEVREYINVREEPAP